MAARRPAPPAPITRTSYSWISYLSIRSSSSVLEETRVVEDAHGAHANVEIGEAHREQAHPRPGHVVLVEHAQKAPRLAAIFTAGHAGEAIELAAHEMAQRVAGERVHG